MPALVCCVALIGIFFGRGQMSHYDEHSMQNYSAKLPNRYNVSGAM